MANLKLPHWAQLMCGFLVVATAWTVQQSNSGDLTLPAVAVSVLTVLQTVLGLLSPSVKS